MTASITVVSNMVDGAIHKKRNITNLGESANKESYVDRVQLSIL
jgi:hypothetical protein